MRTPINCPACQTQYAADVNQIVDAGKNPELKEALLAGYLNVAQCPSCGAVTQVSGPLLYHDPDHELFMVHVPMEMGLALQEQEQMIGTLVKQAMDSLPPSERRGYMFQPQTVLSMQSFMEQIWQTEGVTPEMLARQRAQSELLRLMVMADSQAVDDLIQSRNDEIDETFFAMLRSMRESADSSGDEKSSIKLTNIQAKLYRQTEVGQMLEKRQLAIHEFSKDVKKANGLAPDLLLKHVLANRDAKDIVEALVIAGQPAFNYQFFLLLSEKIDKRQKAGINAEKLVALREQLLQLQEEIEERSRVVLNEASSILQEIMAADDKVAAVQSRRSKIDETVLYVLSASIAQAEEQGNTAQINDLREIQAIISSQMEQEAPPEIRMINDLVRSESFEEQQRILDENAELIRPELIQVLDLLAEDVDNRGQEELGDRLQLIRNLVDARLAA
jgi:hypothetical protein